MRTAEQTQVTSPPESLQGAPPDHIRSVSEQYKQEINQDNRLAKSHHEFEVAQGASDIARDSLVKHLSKATGEDISSKDIPALQSSKPELFDNPKVKGAMEVYEKAESKAEQSRAEFAQSFDNFRAQHAREPTGHEISQHETERYLNTDWDSARLSIESKLTEYHRLADKGSDEAVRLERAVLEDMGRVSGNEKINPKIMDEEGARLLVERGDALSSKKKFDEFIEKHGDEEIQKMHAFIEKHGDELHEIDKLSKNLSLSHYKKLGESRGALLKRSIEQPAERLD